MWGLDVKFLLKSYIMQKIKKLFKKILLFYLLFIFIYTLRCVQEFSSVCIWLMKTFTCEEPTNAIIFPYEAYALKGTESFN